MSGLLGERVKHTCQAWGGKTGPSIRCDRSVCLGVAGTASGAPVSIRRVIVPGRYTAWRVSVVAAPIGY